MKWNVNNYKKNASYVSTYGEDVLSLLEPRAGEHILDHSVADTVLIYNSTLDYGIMIIWEH